MTAEGFDNTITKRMDSKRLLENFEEIFDEGSPERGLLDRIDPEKLPRHVAVIMDGNGRWARRRRLPRVAGHRAGIEAVKATVETSARLGIPFLTLYAFSAENWKRPAAEVNTLMGLLKEHLHMERNIFREHDIRLHPIGRLHELPDSVHRELITIAEETRNARTMTLIVALNYSGRLEMVDAFNSLLRSGKETVSEDDIAARLYTEGFPDPDLLLRTSGEFRVSNFLLWQIAYSEIYVTDTLWPDFRAIHFLEAMIDFQRRSRRYGGIEAVPVSSGS